MEKDHKISVTDHSYLNTKPSNAQGPSKYSSLNVSIEGSFVGLLDVSGV